LFEYRNSDFHQILSFNMGVKSVPKSLSDKYEKRGQSELRDVAKSKHYIPYILYAFPFKGHYFIVADDEFTNCYAINIQNKKTYNNGTLSTYFNLPEKKSLKHPGGVQDDLIIFHCNPSDFFDSKTSMAAKEIQIAGHNIEVNQDDNPILIIIQ